MYLSYYGSKDTNKTKNILYYVLCVLYVLSVATLSLGIVSFMYFEVSSQPIHKNDHSFIRANQLCSLMDLPIRIILLLDPTVVGSATLSPSQS